MEAVVVRQKWVLMPEKCDGCGEVFDLGFDLGTEGLDVREELEQGLQGALFCWECRSFSRH